MRSFILGGGVVAADLGVNSPEGWEQFGGPLPPKYHLNSSSMPLRPFELDILTVVVARSAVDGEGEEHCFDDSTGIDKSRAKKTSSP